MFEINLRSLKMRHCFSTPARSATRLLLLLSVLFTARYLYAAATGPTLQLDYGRGTTPASPISDFMYFVPLIAPEAVSIFTNAGNTQGALIKNFNCRTNETTFSATCDFEFTGNGSLQNLLDHSAKIAHRQQDLAAGQTLAHQLDSINVQGSGEGSVEISGTFTNGGSASSKNVLSPNSLRPTPSFTSAESCSRKN